MTRIQLIESYKAAKTSEKTEISRLSGCTGAAPAAAAAGGGRCVTHERLRGGAAGGRPHDQRNSWHRIQVAKRRFRISTCKCAGAVPAGAGPGCGRSVNCGRLRGGTARGAHALVTCRLQVAGPAATVSHDHKSLSSHRMSAISANQIRTPTIQAITSLGICTETTLLRRHWTARARSCLTSTSRCVVRVLTIFCGTAQGRARQCPPGAH